MSNDRFPHERVYRGADFTDKLSQHYLIICGVGALGSNLVDSLARVGFPRMRVIDKDRVEISNLGTQVYGEMDVGALKADALKNRIFRHVGTEIESVNKELTASNVKTLLKGATLVIDMFDNSASRQLVQDECRARKIACLHAGLFEDYGEVVWDQKYIVPQQTVEGDVCDYPLARNIAILTVTVAAEEILDFCLADKPRQKNWSITMKDLKIQERR